MLDPPADGDGAAVKRHSLHSDLQAIERELLGKGDEVEVTTAATAPTTSNDGLIVGKKRLFAGGAAAAERRVYAPEESMDNEGSGDFESSSSIDGDGGSKVAYGAVMQKPDAVVGVAQGGGGAADDFGLLHYLLYNTIMSSK